MPDLTLHHTFKHEWKEIALASWRKYPCASRPDILSVDIIRRQFDPKTQILSSTRLLTNKSQLPSFINYMVGERADVAFCVEESEVDPVNKKMVLRGRNLTFSKFITVEETCTYTPSPENPEWTSFKQEVTIKVAPYEKLSSVTSYIEDFSINKFTENAQKGQHIMEQTIAKLRQEAEATLTKFKGDTSTNAS